MIEEYAGDLPLWLSPIQASILNISNAQEGFCSDLYKKLNTHKIRTEMDLRNEKISYKVREHSAAKIPVIIAIGAREKESKTVSIRRIGSDKTESMTFNEALKVLSNENSNPHQSGN